MFAHGCTSGQNFTGVNYIGIKGQFLRTRLLLGILPRLIFWLLAVSIDLFSRHIETEIQRKEGKKRMEMSQWNQENPEHTEAGQQNNTGVKKSPDFYLHHVKY